MSNPRESGSDLSKGALGILQMEYNIRGIMKIKKLDIEGDMYLSMFYLRNSIEAVNLYIQGAL